MLKKLPTCKDDQGISRIVLKKYIKILGKKKFRIEINLSRGSLVDISALNDVRQSEKKSFKVAKTRIKRKLRDRRHCPPSSDCKF